MYKKIGVISVVALMFLLGSHCFGQTRTEVDRLYQYCQQCLDNTGQTAKCQSILYSRLDSVLNVVYHNLMQSLSDEGQKTALKDEQIAWLKKRDAFFTKIKKETAEKTEPDTEIYDTQVLEKENEYVRSRILDLIDRLQKTK